MDTPRYITRRIDQAALELLPSGELLIWQAGHTQPLVLAPQIAYAVYLFLLTPGVRPALRKLDDERQRATWDQRQGT